MWARRGTKRIRAAIAKMAATANNINSIKKKNHGKMKSQKRKRRRKKKK